MYIINQRQSNGSAAIYCPLNFFQSLNIFAILFSLMRKDAKSCCSLPMCSVGTVARCARGVQACCAAGTFVELFTCLLDKGSKLRLCQFKENMIKIGSKFGLRLRTRKEAVETAAWLKNATLDTADESSKRFFGVQFNGNFRTGPCLHK